MSNFNISDTLSRTGVFDFICFLAWYFIGSGECCWFLTDINLIVYEHNHYAFRADGNNSITIGTEVGDEYNGTEV